MLRNLRVVLISASALALGACSSSSSPDGGTTNLCAGVSGTCTGFPAGTSAATISAAISSATTGSTFVFGAGTFSLSSALTLPAASGITITGAGIGSTILDFSNPTSGTGDGIDALLGNGQLTISNLTVQNTTGDGIKVEGANGVLFNTVQVTWTNASNLLDGAYGIYPVQSQNVVVEGCQVSGARDTGIYVGQSFDIIVRNNKVNNNVAGIEIESSVSADVYGNESTANSGGILVFALPTLLPPPSSGVSNDTTLNVRVFNNNIHDNNTPNFGDPSGTVSNVPGGTGLVVMASTNVEIFGNTIANNNSAAYAVISYFLINPTFNPVDPTQNPTELNPFPSNVYAHDNTFSGNGTDPIGDNVAPDGGQSPNVLGELLAYLVGFGGFPSGVPDMLWDGIALTVPQGGSYTPPPAPTDAGSAGTPPNPVGYYIESNGSATFANLNFIELVPCGNASCITPTALVFNSSPFVVASPPTGFPLASVDAGF